jgi:hypothetical protein
MRPSPPPSPPSTSSSSYSASDTSDEASGDDEGAAPRSHLAAEPLVVGVASLDAAEGEGEGGGDDEAPQDAQFVSALSAIARRLSAAVSELSSQVNRISAAVPHPPHEFVADVAREVERIVAAQLALLAARTIPATNSTAASPEQARGRASPSSARAERLRANLRARARDGAAELDLSNFDGFD